LARGLPRGHLQAVEIGNEPDLYGVVPWYGERVKTGRPRRLVKHFARYRYEFRRFMSEYRRMAGAVRDAVPNARLVGPGFVTPKWVRHLPAFVAGARGLGLVELTAHRYPLRRCHLPVGSPEWASLSHLLGDGAAAGSTRAVSPYLRLARRRRLSFRIAEMNSLACRGAPSLSDGFASALWGIDTLFELTHAGVSGVNIHTRPLSYYSPLYFHRVAGRWSARVMPLYYALWLFARVTPPGTRVQRVATPPGTNLKVWALNSPGQTRLVVIDKQPHWRGVVRLAIRGRPGRAQLTRLRSASLMSTSPPYLGGQTFGLRSYDARLRGRRRSSWLRPAADGSYSVSFGQPGVAVLRVAH
jgi:hypothetical protein